MLWDRIGDPCRREALFGSDQAARRIGHPADRAASVPDVNSEQECDADVGVSGSGLLPRDAGQRELGLGIDERMEVHHLRNSQLVRDLRCVLDLAQGDADQSTVTRESADGSAARGKISLLSDPRESGDVRAPAVSMIAVPLTVEQLRLHAVVGTERRSEGSVEETELCTPMP